MVPCATKEIASAVKKSRCVKCLGKFQINAVAVECCKCMVPRATKGIASAFQKSGRVTLRDCKGPQSEIGHYKVYQSHSNAT
jgi:hypothetical protein